MIKLYPPDIGGIIPAFYGDEIKVPFAMNKMVNKSEVGGFKLIFKPVSNSKILLTLEAGIDETSWDKDNSIVVFSIKDNLKAKEVFNVGQYYKVQMAYIYNDSNREIGYYSNVATIKYTTKPTVEVSAAASSQSERGFIGTYTQDQFNGDIREKVYSYRFDIYNESDTAFLSSGELLHNSFEDDLNYSSNDVYLLTEELPVGKNYFIQYTVTTVNKLTVSSDKLMITNPETVDMNYALELQAINNYDNGYIKLILKDRDLNNETNIQGSFIIKRASNKSNYGSWESLKLFTLNGLKASQWSWIDKTVEFGYEYQYSIQQYDEYLTSNKVLSNKIKSDFESMFLFDGERQLKFSFNQKISSFKDTLLEQKTNTIGGKHPFFFRNGKVCFKEFPLSGLISYYDNEEELFISADSIYLNPKEKTTNLISENIFAEKNYRLEILNWLNNGKPKLFRSPTEGNYIVRIYNVSFAPQESLGRMLYTFSASAVEVADYSYTELINNNFINLQEEIIKVPLGETVLLREFLVGEELLKNAPIIAFSIENAPIGTQFNIDNEIITIGPSGAYSIDLKENFTISSIILLTEADFGILTYYYYKDGTSVFSDLSKIEIKPYQISQYIGASNKEKNNIIPKIEEFFSYDDEEVTYNVQGLRNELYNLKYIKLYKKVVMNIYQKGGSYYTTSSGENQIYLDQLQTSWYIFHLQKYTSTWLDKGYCLREDEDWIPLDSNSNYFYYEIDGNYYSLYEDEIVLSELGKDISSFYIGPGVVAECIYQQKEKTYIVELNEDSEVFVNKETYLNSFNLLDFSNLNDDASEEELITFYGATESPSIESIQSAYLAYLISLHKALRVNRELSGEAYV